MSNSIPLSTSWVSFIAGACAGFVEVTCCYPLDTMKTRLQVTPNMERESWSNIGRISKQLLKERGIITFYQGISVMYLSVIPKNAVRFTTYDLCRSSFSLTPFWSGCISGMIESILVVTPTDVIKIRIQSQQSNPLSLFHQIQCLWKENGWKSYYRGIGFTTLRQSTNQASNFWMYETLRQSFPSLPVFWVGCISGSIGPLLNHPVDVIKTQYQLQTPSSSLPMSSLIHNIWRKEGVWGFYRGFLVRWIRIFPGQGIVFTVVDTCRQWFSQK